MNTALQYSDEELIKLYLESNLLEYEDDGISTIKTYGFCDFRSLSRIKCTNLRRVNTCVFQGCVRLSDVSIPLVQMVDPSAFYNCRKLEFLNISNASIIGQYAFYGCEKLSSIILRPSSVTLGSYAFAHTGLTNFTVYDNYTGGGYAFIVPEAAFYDCQELSEISVITSRSSNYLEISCYAFAHCKKLKSFPFSIICSASYAVFANTGFSSIVLSNRKAFNASQFASCHELKYVSFTNLSYLYGSILQDCFNLRFAYLSTISTIQSNALKHCFNLQHLILGSSSVVNINSTAFCDTYSTYKRVYISGLNVYVPSSLISDYQADSKWSYFSSYCSFKPIEECSYSYDPISSYVYRNTSQIIVSDDVESIKKKITELDLPNVTTISGMAFDCCVNLSTLTLSSVEIKAGGFANCFNLKEITLKNVILGNGVFNNCRQLSSAKLENIQIASWQPFDYCSLDKLFVKGSMSVKPGCFLFGNMGTELRYIVFPGLEYLYSDTTNGIYSLTNGFNNSNAWLYLRDIKNPPNRRIHFAGIRNIVFDTSALISSYFFSSTFSLPQTYLSYKFYFPDSYVNQYKSALSWSNISDIIYPISLADDNFMEYVRECLSE